MNHPLTRYHDTSKHSYRGYPKIYAWNERTALILLSGFYVTFVPLGDAEHEGEPTEVVRKCMRESLEAEPVKEMRMSLGALTQWALRRGKPCVRDCDECEVVFWPQDFQRVMGEPVFDRLLIRESMQWLYESRVSMHAEVRLQLVKGPSHASPSSEWHTLVMRSGDWTGIVMCCRADTKVGEDPLG